MGYVCTMISKFSPLLVSLFLSGIGLTLQGCFIATAYTHSEFKRAKELTPFDVVIVPGVPYTDTALGDIFKARILWAKYLYDNKLAKNLIFSGSAVYSPYVEGKVMKIFADSLGIPSKHTFSESKAEHSTENVYYSWLMAKEMGFTNIAVASDPFQILMLKSFIRKRTPGVNTIPIVFQWIDMKKVLPKIDPATAVKKHFVSIMEKESFSERFKGTRGKKIKFVSDSKIDSVEVSPKD